MEKRRWNLLDCPLIARTAMQNEVLTPDRNGDDWLLPEQVKVAVCRSSNSCGMPAITVIFSSQTQRIL
jgi:hypothetical protein